MKSSHKPQKPLKRLPGFYLLIIFYRVPGKYELTKSKYPSLAPNAAKQGYKFNKTRFQQLYIK